MIPASDVFLQCETDWIFQKCFFFICLDTFLCALTVCLSVDSETTPALANTVQGSLAGIRVCEHIAAKRSHRPAYHLHDNPLTAHQVMMTGNARLPLAWHLHYLLVPSAVFPRSVSVNPSLQSVLVIGWFGLFVHLILSHLCLFILFLAWFLAPNLYSWAIFLHITAT